MERKRAILAGFRGHARQWFGFHRDQIDLVAFSGAVNDRTKQDIDACKYDGRHYDDPAEMIAKEKADIALIWTPKTEDHVPLGYKALDRGMHVMLEKPLSEDPAEAIAFVEAAEKADRRAMIMQNIRWQQPAMEVKEALDQQRIGQLYWLETSMRGMFNGFIYEGIHVTDLARYWFNRPAQWVHGVSVQPTHRQFKDNLVAMSIGFEGGGVARVVMDWSSVGHHNWIKARLQGDKAAMTVTWGEPIQLQEPGKPVVAIPKWTTVCNDMKKLLEHFIDCIDKGATPINNVRDQLKTLDIIFAARESARTNQVVKLPFRFAQA